ncbi:MAG TPA: amino acid ABC transporter permease [Acidimicrobiia bacterium]|nr:amino acid ABC transporter permease [Acidimicrobiia bacterium]
MTIEVPPIVEDRVERPAVDDPRDWVKQNLFNTWYNSVLTIGLGALIVAAAVYLVRAVLGADYTIIQRNLTLFMVGQFPRDQLWRPAVSAFLIAVIIGLVAGVVAASARDRAAESGQHYEPTKPWAVVGRFSPIILLVIVILSFTTTITPTLIVIAMAAGGVVTYLVARRLPASVRRWTWLGVLLLLAGAYLVLAGFGGVGWEDWGGLHLNLFLTAAGILFAFPLGLLFALGRRSSLPAVRTISVVYIEFVRGVPLILLLLFGAFAIGFLLPRDVRPGLVTRMLIAITLFEAAYIAEVVRGGLQSIPKGQVEASQSLGMPPWRTMRRIVLPQALRATIPAMVGQFISLYKDTTLVSILGVLELLRVAFVVNTQPDFFGQGLIGLTLAFAGLIFWVGSFMMSRESRRLERKLGVGER